MSTNSNCEIIEIKTGKWYYILEDYNAPKNAWDWRDYATAYGPFRDEAAALEHLDQNHANPGGYSTSRLPMGTPELDLSKDATLARLIESADSAQGHIGAFTRYRY